MLINPNSDKLASDDVVVLEDTHQEEIPFFGDADNAEQEDTSVADDEAAKAEEERFNALTPEDQQAETEAKEKKRFEALTPEQQQEGLQQLENKRIADEAAAAEAAKNTPDLEAAKAQWLKELGVNSIEEAKQKLNPAAPETDEQKAQKAQMREAGIAQYAVKNNIMSLDMIRSYQIMSAMPPEDLVFNQFEKEYKDSFKDRKNDDNASDPVTEDEVRDAFENTYHTNSDNPVLKARGEKALKAAAGEILGEAKEKYDYAKNEYDFLIDRSVKIPEYKGFINAVFEQEIPETKEFTVGDQKIMVKLDGKDKEEIQKIYKDEAVFNAFFKNTDKQGFKADMKKQISQFLSDKYIGEAMKLAMETGKGLGLKERPVGARAPFDPQKQAKPQPNEGKLSPEERANNRAGLKSITY